MSDTPAGAAPAAGAPAAGADAGAQAAAAAAEAKHKIKVKGQEIELPLSEILKRAEKAEGADLAFNEAQKQLREAQKLTTETQAKLEAIKKDPKGFIKKMNDMGLDWKQVVKDLVYEDIQESKLTPEEKEARANKAELERMKAEKTRQEELIKQTKLSAAKKAEMIKLAGEINTAITDAKLPNDSITRRWVTYFMLEGKNQGVVITAKQATDLTRKKLIQDFKTTLEALAPEQWSEYIPSTFIENLRKKDLQEFQKKGAGGQPPRKDPTPKKEKEPKQPGSLEEWKKKVRSGELDFRPK